ncbi:MAG: hypothetical protein CM1200mP20_14770 [Pseudomonadota bacterium]|nr:MAG: hypothetical protein CM1200mP20_14770 [Pseudomonadota bacterium]
MSLSIEQKKAVVSEVSEVFNLAQAAVLAEYRGLSVEQITELRAQARENGVEVRVVKNTWPGAVWPGPVSNASVNTSQGRF